MGFIWCAPVDYTLTSDCGSDGGSDLGDISRTGDVFSNIMGSGLGDSSRMIMNSISSSDLSGEDTFI